MRITKWDKAAIVKAIMADVPKIDKDKRRKEMQEAVVKLMTPECRKVYKSMPDALRTYHVGNLLYNGLSYNTREIVRGDVPEKALKALEAKYEAEDKVVRDAEYSLKGAIEACTTLKQLNDRLPEFKKYFPTEQKPVANLPALANVVADLTKLGWPKK
jgi:hypothetical protein